jgi:hypothetical protein
MHCLSHDGRREKEKFFVNKQRKLIKKLFIMEIKDGTMGVGESACGDTFRKLHVSAHFQFNYPVDIASVWEVYGGG